MTFATLDAIQKSAQLSDIDAEISQSSEHIEAAKLEYERGSLTAGLTGSECFFAAAEG